ncbi:MAG: cytochrome c-type biogenesis protein [Pseudomonadota bacterium]
MIRALMIICALASAAFAVEPDEILVDPVLEQRARDISANVRCVVCQNEPIDSSNSAIARDLRILIRERLVAGDTDNEVYTFLVDRYGSYILFRPPLNAATLPLWIGPFLILFFAIFGACFAFRNTERSPKKLSSEEEANLQRLRDEDNA